jgi:hypothetical protein
MLGVPWSQSNSRVFSVGLLLAVCLAASARAEQIAAADRVVVRKSEHKLYLYSGDRLLGSYQVKLGLAPVGQKEREHDFRTPEGTIVWRGATPAAISSCPSRCPIPTRKTSCGRASIAGSRAA